jgi:rhodanese-related sulfurtransferase
MRSSARLRQVPSSVIIIVGRWSLALTDPDSWRISKCGSSHSDSRNFDKFDKIFFDKIFSRYRPPLRAVRNLMAQQHSPRFLQIVEDARGRIREVSVDDVKTRIDRGENLVLLDVREESEYARDHLPGAIHLGKGVIERDIEQRVPQLDTPLVLYCGGGYRSALAADNLQKMGYTDVLSMDGGIREWREKHLPLTSG